ncbi:MAG TPA: ABC transporter ATP-binding protein [bacterium]|nr:ABC transporter ATP-binding protein [bacterium]
MIQTIDLCKDYGKFRAVDRVNLLVRPGEIFGFLGPNGAGKTTTIRMLIGLLRPTSGRVIIDGHDLDKEPVAAKSVVGFIPDRPYLYEKLTGEEFLKFMAGLYGVDGNGVASRITDLLRFFDLTDWRRELIESYSHGMKQRLVMASALIHQPKAIIVDEPMVGLDPRGAKLLKEAFKKLASEGVAIFMSTHTLEIAEQMCDRLAIINEARIIAEGTVEELRRRAEEKDGAHLEDIFLSLVGAEDMKDVIAGLKP